MSDKDFYAGYRERLETKLKQKAAQIARNQQQVGTIASENQGTYRKLIEDAQAQRDEIQRELTVLIKVINDTMNEKKGA
jgi:predicted secreted protein